MVKHIVLWNFREDMTDEEKREAGEKIRSLLKPIREKVPGTVEIQVVLNELDSSNRDVALLSVFETVEALQAYQTHPDHVAAKGYIGSVTCNRTCMDYEY